MREFSGIAYLTAVFVRFFQSRQEFSACKTSLQSSHFAKGKPLILNALPSWYNPCSFVSQGFERKPATRCLRILSGSAASGPWGLDGRSFVQRDELQARALSGRGMVCR